MKKAILAVGTSLVAAIVSKAVKGKRIVLIEDLVISNSNNGEFKSDLRNVKCSMIVIDGQRNGKGELRVKFDKGTVFEIDQDYKHVIINNGLKQFKGCRRIRAREITDNEEAAQIWFRCEGEVVESFARGFFSAPSSNKVIEQFSAQIKKIS